MADRLFNAVPPIDVAVIGGGPAGLAAATALKAAGVVRVVVLDREAEAGGIPRHCGHIPFGMREFTRILKGPDYASRLVERAQAHGVEIHTRATVIEALPGGELSVSTPDGSGRIYARRVIYATGVRETPRSARLISGARVGGVLNTGALQAMVYLNGHRPFSRPVILGSELVAFSSLLTCAHAAIRPVAMLESGKKAIARWPVPLLAKLKRVPVLTSATLLSIEGKGKVESVRVRMADGKEREIDCDGVILTGTFTPEAALARNGHLEVDPATGGPRVDQWGRCSDPAYFATGNLLRPVETAGWSWAEGRRTAIWVDKDLKGRLPSPKHSVPIELRDPRLKYAMPQRLEHPDDGSGMSAVQLRVREAVSGRLTAFGNGVPLYRRNLNSGPERRILVPLSRLVSRGDEGAVSFIIESASDLEAASRDRREMDQEETTKMEAERRQT